MRRLPQTFHRPDIGRAPFVGVGVHRVFHLEKGRRLARAAQIVDDQINALFIVGAYERLADLIDVRIEQDGRDLFGKGLDLRVIRTAPESGQQYARRFQHAQVFEVLQLHLGAAVRPEQNGPEALPQDVFFDRAGNLGKERVGQMRHHDADVLGQTAVLVHGVKIGPIVISVQRCLNPFAGAATHAGGVVEELGKRRTGDPADGGKLFHILDFPTAHQTLLLVVAEAK